MYFRLRWPSMPSQRSGSNFHGSGKNGLVGVDEEGGRPHQRARGQGVRLVCGGVGVSQRCIGRDAGVAACESKGNAMCLDVDCADVRQRLELGQRDRLRCGEFGLQVGYDTRLIWEVVMSRHNGLGGRSRAGHNSQHSHP